MSLTNKHKIISFYDPSLISDIEYATTLFNELKNLNKKILCQGTINILGKSDEFLKIAKEAGLFSWYIGFESISQKSLNETNKKVNQVDDYRSSIKKIKDYNMIINGAFVFGFDNDGPDIFEKTYDSIKNWDIDMVDFHILTPFPGTVLYKRLKKEGRILTEDWDKYNLVNVVFQPKNMSAKELFEGTRWITKKYFSVKNIIKRYYKAIERHKDYYLSTYVLLQTRRRIKRLNIKKAPIITTIECQKCDYKSTRVFARGDYILKEMDPCEKCKENMLITSIYRVIKEKKIKKRF